MRLQQIEMLYLLWAIPVLIGFYAYAAARRRKALETFAEAGLLKHINVSVSAVRRGWKAVLVLAASALTIVALARPGWNPKPKSLQRQGRDVMFLLDVSKSMLAQDLAPNRLERAKLAILDCVEKLQGDRVGLVVFAGTAAVQCPLTLDYGFFRMMLESVNTESIARGGTMIGDAVRKALDEGFGDREKRYKDIVLITDGEDQESFPVQAAESAGKSGVRIIAIGIGDEDQGRRIPITDKSGRRAFLTYKGQEVWSKLDADTLRKMANATPGGKFLKVATGAIDLGDVYAQLISTAEKKELEAKSVELYEERFQAFLALAGVLLCVELALGEHLRAKPAAR
jgi:Ca-activated chloride channel family protein